MSESEVPATQKPSPEKLAAEKLPEKPAAEKPAPKQAAPLVLDARFLNFDELAAAKSQLSSAELMRQLQDGRDVVRANAILGLAVLGQASPELVPFLRDGELRVAVAAAEAIVRLGSAMVGLVSQIAAALDGAKPPVVDVIQRWFAELVGIADTELTTALDTGSEVIAKTIVQACTRIDIRGLHFLESAATDERTRVRINAVRGIALIGDLDPVSAFDTLVLVEQKDQVADVRAAARTAVVTLKQRLRANAVSRVKHAEPPPLVAPEIIERALKPDEVKGAAGKAPVDELLLGLEHPRVHVRLNAVRAFAARGTHALGQAGAVAVLLRDPDASVRIETAQTLAALVAVHTAPALVEALGDPDTEVVSAADKTLVGFGEMARDALAAGLETPNEAAGVRAATLLARLPGGTKLLVDAVSRSTSVDVRVHAALGLARGTAEPAVVRTLTAIAVGGQPRVRAAAIRALDVLVPRTEPPQLGIPGFYDRVLGDDDLAKAKDQNALALAAQLADARPHVRVNAANALAQLGPDATAAMQVLAASLRDDASEVRVAAARALDKIGDTAIALTAPDLVTAFLDAEPALAAQLTKLFAAKRRGAIDDALVRALDTTDPQHAARMIETIAALPQAVELFSAAFARPADAGRKNAARGFERLGDKLGAGRKPLEDAVAHGSGTLRDLARATLRTIDGPPAEPKVPAVPGFETALLDGKTKPAGLAPGDLVPFLQDGRAIVRANAATLLGALAAKPHVYSLKILLRDDDTRVRIATARAIDALGDEAVVAAAPDLVGALKGEPAVADVVKPILAARKAAVETALIAGLETGDETHGMRIAELICGLPNAKELLFIAFDSPAQNVQINAALGIGLLGPKEAGVAGRRRLEYGLAGPFTRRRDAMVKALALLDRAAK
ncbi:MAG: HEAT repeat domain-containing protein [Kofleriaceae bacterium]